MRRNAFLLGIPVMGLALLWGAGLLRSPMLPAQLTPLPGCCVAYGYQCISYDGYGQLYTQQNCIVRDNNEAFDESITACNQACGVEYVLPGTTSSTSAPSSSPPSSVSSYSSSSYASSESSSSSSSSSSWSSSTSWSSSSSSSVAPSCCAALNVGVGKITAPCTGDAYLAMNDHDYTENEDEASIVVQLEGEEGIVTAEIYADAPLGTDAGVSMLAGHEYDFYAAGNQLRLGYDTLGDPVKYDIDGNPDHDGAFPTEDTLPFLCRVPPSGITAPYVGVVIIYPFTSSSYSSSSSYSVSVSSVSSWSTSSWSSSSWSTSSWSSESSEWPSSSVSSAPPSSSPSSSSSVSSEPDDDKYAYCCLPGATAWDWRKLGSGPADCGTDPIIGGSTYEASSASAGTAASAGASAAPPPPSPSTWDCDGPAPDPQCPPGPVSWLCGAYNFPGTDCRACNVCRTSLWSLEFCSESECLGTIGGGTGPSYDGTICTYNPVTTRCYASVENATCKQQLCALSDAEIAALPASQCQAPLEYLPSSWWEIVLGWLGILPTCVKGPACS